MSKKVRRSNLFIKDVSSLLYAYGDVAQPLQETIHCLDDLVAGYLVDICVAASRSAQNSKRSKLKLEDFKFAIRHDSVKLARAEELIATNKLITEAKKQFNSTDNQSLKKIKEGDDEDGDDEEEEEEEADENQHTSDSKRKPDDEGRPSKTNKKTKRVKQ